MRRLSRVFIGTAIVATLGALGPVAVAQPAPGTAAAKAAPPLARPAGPLPPGHPQVGEQLPAGHPPVDEGLPAGHPQVGEQLPAGHPPVDADDDDDGSTVEHLPRHGRGGADPRFFEPPPDITQDDPSLPIGTLVVTIKDAQDRPVPGAPITLGVVHNTVAKGESHERFARAADGEGSTRFDGLTIGSGTTFRVSTTRGPATYAAMPFPLSDKVGKRVVVHAYDVAADIEGLPVGMQGMVYVSLKEDAIQVEQLFSVFNLGAVSWVADVPFDLPRGFKAFNKPEAMADTRVDEVSGTGGALRGTFSPGRHEITFRYQIPLDEVERQTLSIELPPHTAQVRVLAESSKSMGLEVAGFPPAQRAPNREGKKLLVTERQVARMEGGLKTIELTLTGMRPRGPGRWIAAGIGATLIIAGFAYLRFRRSDGGLDDDARNDLVEAREALLEEIVALERARVRGDVGPKTYARLHASLLDALARIVDMLESARKPKVGVNRPDRQGRPAESVS